MKTLIKNNYSSFLVLISFLLIQATVNNDLMAQSADKDHFTVQVDGLGCPFCAYGLEKKFKELKGIGQVKINMETGVMNFIFPSDQALSEEVVERQVELAGYTPMWIEVKRGDGTVTKKSLQSESAPSQFKANDKATMAVSGKCSMCKKRIERTALGVSGVTNAEWNQKKQELLIEFDNTVVSADDVERKIVAVGHDTQNFKAGDDVYKTLPACCKYKRKK